MADNIMGGSGPHIPDRFTIRIGPDIKIQLTRAIHANPGMPLARAVRKYLRAGLAEYARKRDPLCRE